jgi:hypothetical protein
VVRNPKEIICRLDSFTFRTDVQRVICDKDHSEA